MRNRAGLTAILIVAAIAALPGSASAGVSAENGCSFTEFTRYPGLSTWPETNTQVYQCVYWASEAGHTVVRGHRPNARFWSLALVDQARREIASIVDDNVDVAADGSFKIDIRLDCDGARSCLSARGGPAPGTPALMYYRIYVPEPDGRGGVPLPKASYVVDGGPPDAALPGPFGDDTLQDLMDEGSGPLRPGGSIYETLASPSGREADVPQPPAGEEPEVTRAGETGEGQLNTLEDNGVPRDVTDVVRNARTAAGGFGGTKDNVYVSVKYQMNFGNVEIRAKAPTYRKQHQVAKNDYGVADGSEQVRFWSLCSTQATRPVDCLRDENVVLDPNGFFRLVIAPSCPVAGYDNCLRAGRLNGLNGASVPLLLFRNTLGSDSFANDDGPNVCPEQEAPSQYCGDYKPVARYVPRITG